MKYTLYKVIKGNSNIKGYWIDKGKVYIDSITQLKCNNKHILREHITELFNDGELAVFYTQGDIGIIEDNKGNIQELNKRLEFKHKKNIDNTKKIKKIISQYSGCTIYNKRGYILIEVYTN